MKIRATDHIAITVTDLEENIRFYHDVLGLPVTESFYDEHEKAQIVFLEAEGCQIELLAPDTWVEGKTTSEQERGLSHLAFLVEGIEEACQDLKARGVSFIQDPLESHGLKWAYFQGPEGVILELIERLKEEST